MSTNKQEKFIQIYYMHDAPKMQLITFIELEDFVRKHGSMDYTELEN